MTKWLVGIIPGSIAAIVAALVSLPLESPDDAILNSGTVTVGALIAGLLIGVAWAAFSDRPIIYGGVVAGLLVAAIALAAIFEAELSGAFKYMATLGVIVIAICAVLTPFVDQLLTSQQLQLGGSAVGLVAALGLGIGLSGQGDTETEQLGFPEAEATAVATATVATGATAAQTPSTSSPSESVITIDDIQGVTYTVVPDESTVQYTVTEKLAFSASESDAQGSTGTVSGDIHLDESPSNVSFDASTFVSDQDRRDNAVREIFASDPTVTFVVENLSGLPESYTSGQTVTMFVTGTATVRGVVKNLTFEVQGKFDGDQLQLLATTDFVWSDFNIEPPNRAGFVTVHDDVHIEVLLIANPG